MRSAKASSTGSTPRDGRQAPSHRLPHHGVFFAAVLTCVAVFLPSTSASASVLHTFHSSFTPNGLTSPDGLAVDASSGTVYVDGQSGTSYLYKFDSNGNPQNFSGPSAPQITLEDSGNSYGLAVDNSTSLSDPSVGDIYDSNTDGNIYKFASSGACIPADCTTPWVSHGSVPTGIAVDGSGNVYVADAAKRTVDEYTQGGIPNPLNPILSALPGPPLSLAVDSSGEHIYVGEANGYGTIEYNSTNCALPSGCAVDSSSSGRGVAIDPANSDIYTTTAGGSKVGRFGSVDYHSLESPFGSFSFGFGMAVFGTKLYVADYNNNVVSIFDKVTLPEVTTSAVTNLANDSATLNGHFELDAADGGGQITGCKFEYGTDPSYGHSAPCAEGNSFSAAANVHTDIENLDPLTKYHYRLDATNAQGTGVSSDQTFTTSSAPTINSFTSSNLQADSVDLHAVINPEGFDTEYHFEYGHTTAYGSRAPDSDALIPASNSNQPVSLHLTGLDGGVYHFRVVASSVKGVTKSTDQSFNFYPPICPNGHLRQQSNSDSLPDCRAYELVSPANSGNALIFPAGATPNTGQATNPSRLAYGTWGGVVPGIGANPSNTIGDMYVATRTDNGWASKYIGLPANQAFLVGGPPWRANINIYAPDKWQQGVLADPSLSTVIDWNDGEYATGCCPFDGAGPGTGSSNAPYVWDSTTGRLIDRWPTNLGAVSGGERFTGETAASADLSHFVFSSGVVFSPGGVPGDLYDNNTTSDAMSIVSRAPDNSDLQVFPIKVSSDGSHILMASPLQPSAHPVQLYMRVNDTVTYTIAPGHLVKYVGMTADGSKVYFTSNEQLTPNDTDTSTDLYMWSEATNSLTLVSIGNDGTTGNSDSCNASWTSQCGIVPISFATYSTLQGGVGGNGVSDSYMASGNGDIYFYSPQLLDGDKGVTNQQNLYVYRNSGLQFVTTLTPGSVCTRDQGVPICSDGPVARMDVSPDGSHMAFITASQVTPYDNAGHAEMYSYTPSTGHLVCDSCLPGGAPPKADVYGSQNGLFMTNDGRTFFSTNDSLVPQDTNQGEDVYEYVDGRPQLISSGTGAVNNAFGFIGISTLPGLVGVSADGTNAYFATFDVLVGQDLNGEELKIYDARTGGGFPFVKPSPGCAAADECHGAGSSPPSSPADGTGANLGSAGNVQPVGGITHRKKPHKKRRQRTAHRTRQRSHSRG